MKTTVLCCGNARHDMCGQFLGYPLSNKDETISAGLAARLLRYALNRLADAGFQKAVEGWDIEVYTLDGNDKPADRDYCVRFKNTNGGYIEVIGILTRKGWPTLDHGYAIGHE